MTVRSDTSGALMMDPELETPVAYKSSVSEIGKEKLLFNLDNDPSEQDNVALKNMDLVKSMLKELGDWDVSTPHILFLEGARWRRNQLDLYDKEYQLEQPSN